MKQLRMHFSSNIKSISQHCADMHVPCFVSKGSLQLCIHPASLWLPSQLTCQLPPLSPPSPAVRQELELAPLIPSLKIWALLDSSIWLDASNYPFNIANVQSACLVVAIMQVAQNERSLMALPSIIIRSYGPSPLLVFSDKLTATSH